jgi:excisionase family DNA binding protein
MMTGEKLLTVQQAAEQLGLREATVRKLIFQRRIDTVRPSVRAVRVPESAVRRILEQGYRPAVPTQGNGAAS